MLCTICCTLVFNNGYSMNEFGKNFTFGPQDKTNNESEKQESDQKFLDRIETKIHCNMKNITSHIYYEQNLLSSLSNDDQQKLKTLIEERPDLVFNNKIICEFLVEQEPNNEESQCIKSLLHQNSHNKKCLLYFLKYKLKELTIKDVTKPKSEKFLKSINDHIEHVTEIINKELQNM